VPRDLTGVLEAVIAGIVVIDVDGRIELVNSAACRILETSSEAIVGNTLESLFRSNDSIPRMVHEVIAHGGSASENEVGIERRFDDPLVIDVAASPLFGESGPPNGAVLVLRDRTIQKTLEDLVGDRETISAFGEIAAGIAHEVKNPLGGIRGAAELLAARTEEDRTREIADIIVREVQRIAALVDDLMDFTPGDAVHFAAVNIHRVIDEVLDLVSLDPISSKITIERVYDPSIPEFMADADRLAQVFLNLFRNAMQAMSPDPGTLSVRTRMPLDHRLSGPDGNPIATLTIEVSDTGPGIKTEILNKMSTPFFTTRADGTGLGLAVSRNWVSRHGGALRIDSSPGRGTTVRVALPLRRTE
jgi:two-component system nitrogen regulation sensor histidine kinase GlnL